MHYLIESQLTVPRSICVQIPFSRNPRENFMIMNTIFKGIMNLTLQHGSCYTTCGNQLMYYKSGEDLICASFVPCSCFIEQSKHLIINNKFGDKIDECFCGSLREWFCGPVDYLKHWKWKSPLVWAVFCQNWHLLFLYIRNIRFRSNLTTCEPMSIFLSLSYV